MINWEAIRIYKFLKTEFPSQATIFNSIKVECVDPDGDDGSEYIYEMLDKVVAPAISAFVSRCEFIWREEEDNMSSGVKGVDTLEIEDPIFSRINVMWEEYQPHYPKYKSFQKWYDDFYSRVNKNLEVGGLIIIDNLYDESKEINGVVIELHDPYSIRPDDFFKMVKIFADLVRDSGKKIVEYQAIIDRMKREAV